MQRYYFFLFTFLLAAGTVFAQPGTIKGTVKTSDGQPAEFVVIGLKGTTKGCVANAGGEYVIGNVTPGTYTITASLMGLETKEKQVELKAGETLVVDFILTENAKQLQEVVITGTKSANEKPVTIGKSPIKPLDLPQAVATVDRATLEQQQALRVSDALMNFNGVYLMGTSGGYQEELAGRGFAFGSSNTFKNGIRFNNAAMPELSALERIEVMKGSSAILFGNVAAGGVINLVTKKPTFGSGGEVSFRTGSYDFYKPSVDVFGTVGQGKHMAWRMNTTYEKSRSFRDEVKSERFYFNPSLLFRLGNKTSLLVEGDFLSDDRTLDFGVGAINYTLIDVPRSRFIGTSWQYFRTEQKSISATITHRLSEKWEIRSVTSFQEFESDLFGTVRPNASGQFIQPDGRWTRGIQRTRVDEQYAITQLDLVGRFSTGPVKHILLAGADVDKYLTKTFAYNGITAYDTINVFDADKYEQRSDIPSLSVKTTTTAPVERAGFYVQDLIAVTEKIKVLAGARISYLETFSDVYTHSTQATVSSRKFDHAVTPRIGVVYQPIRTMAIFASYANSFTPNTGVDINGNALPPSFIDQYEAGVKNDFFGGLLSANVTVYQIVNSNLAQTSLENNNTNSNVKELAGEVTSQGVEADITSKQWNGFFLIAGYSYNDTKYTRSNTYIVGSKLRYNPNHTANASLVYTFTQQKLRGLYLGAGALYIGDRMAGRSTRVNVANDTYKLIPVDAYTLIDGSVGYSRSNYSVRFKVSNVFNAMSYNVHDDNSVNPIAPRSFAATFSCRF